MSDVALSKPFLKACQSFSAADQGRILAFVAKLSENPLRRGINLEAVKGARDPDIRTGRISQKIRAILHCSNQGMILLHVDKHDEAYRWAVERIVSHHPNTGAIQVLTTVESIQQSINAVPPAQTDSTPLFAKYDDQYLIMLGVPSEWLPALREMRDENQLYMASDRYPENQDIWERLLFLANGEVVLPPIDKSHGFSQQVTQGQLPWVVDEVDDFEQVLHQPFEEWKLYLHPAQSELVEGNYNGPVKITGSPGTGKTIVALHRAAYLACQGRKVLLTSFSTTLCDRLREQIPLLCPSNASGSVDVMNIHKLASDLVRQARIQVRPIDDEDIEALIQSHASAIGVSKFSPDFLKSEWKGVIKAQGICEISEYLNSQRTGRRSRLSADERCRVWEVFERVFQQLADQKQAPHAFICRQARELFERGQIVSPYDAVIADEIQDLGQQEIRLLAQLTSSNPGGLMLIGDGGQRIYAGGYSLKALGVQVSGRSKRLRVSYRTTEEIRRFADRILTSKRDDLDGGNEQSSDSFGLMKGKRPTLRGCNTPEEQAEYLREIIRELCERGIAEDEIGVFVRTGKLVTEVCEILSKGGIKSLKLGERRQGANAGLSEQGVNVGTMHRAKGLEFKAVLVPYCQRGKMPHYPALREQDSADKETVMALEKQLLYVSLTRARDELFVTWVGPPSEFLLPVLAIE